jgi:hypothetical protein
LGEIVSGACATEIVALCGVAAAKLVLPDCVASTVIDPTPVIVSVLPLTVAGAEVTV